MIVQKMKFEELKKGDWFSYDSALLIKTVPIREGATGVYYDCAVDTETGDVYRVHPTTEVFRTPVLDSRICTPVNDPSEVVMQDGFVYILMRETEDFVCSAACLCICPEYDEPVSLADVEHKYPDVFMVIFENALHGEVYRFGNYKDFRWYKCGITCGYV